MTVTFPFKTLSLLHCLLFWHIFAGLALRKYNETVLLYDIMRSWGNDHQKVFQGKNASYDSNNTGDEMVKALNEAMAEELAEALVDTRHFLTIDSTRLEDNVEYASIFVR